MTSITSYEVVARRNGRAVRLHGAPLAAQPHRRHAQARGGVGGVPAPRRAHDSILLGGYPPDFVIGEWRIGFSGRTQARAKQEGELPFFLDAPSKSSRAVHSRG